VVTRHERRGLLGTDLSQLSWGLRFGLLALLLVLAAAVAWALGLGIDALA
jgi:hypothetical protein